MRREMIEFNQAIIILNTNRVKADLHLDEFPTKLETETNSKLYLL